MLLAQERSPAHSNYSQTAGGARDFFFFFLGIKILLLFSLPRFWGEEMENDVHLADASRTIWSWKRYAGNKMANVS